MTSQQTTYPELHFDVAPPIRIWLFGTFRVSVQGVDIPNFRSNRTRALFSYLLLSYPQPSLRRHLDTLFWPDYLAKSARNNLRQALSNLRNILAPFDLITADRNHVYLKFDPAVIWCDVWQFTELLTSCPAYTHHKLAQDPACRACLQQAVTLYRGELLENFPDVDSPSFHAWLQAQRQRFAERFTKAQALLATPPKARGNIRPALTPLVGRASELLALEEKLHHRSARGLKRIKKME